MQLKAIDPKKFIDSLPEERKDAITRLRKTILENLPRGFSESVNEEMIDYVVPHSLYPAGYHCNPKQPLPFMSIASQKNYIAVYHMGVYAEKSLLDWFLKEYAKYFKTKPDMGKSCIRFRKIDQIPYELIGELTAKISPKEWISIYEKHFKK
jgi:hypothetical protein